MYDPEEREKFLQEYEAMKAKVMSPEGRANLLAKGLDPEVELAKATKLKDDYLAADGEYEQAVENQLQAGANVADRMTDLYKHTRELLAESKRLDPLNPVNEQLEELLEALAERVPKEPEE